VLKSAARIAAVDAGAPGDRLCASAAEIAGRWPLHPARPSGRRGVPGPHQAARTALPRTAGPAAQLDKCGAV